MPGKHTTRMQQIHFVRMFQLLSILSKCTFFSTVLQHSQGSTTLFPCLSLDQVRILLSSHPILKQQFVLHLSSSFQHVSSVGHGSVSMPHIFFHFSFISRFLWIFCSYLITLTPSVILLPNSFLPLPNLLIHLQFSSLFVKHLTLTPQTTPVR